MLVWVYKSSRKANAYLYLNRRDDFAHVPDGLMALLGGLTSVLQFDIAKRASLPNADIRTVIRSLEENGYYLQLPPGDPEPESIC
ncbi:MAG: YcgL domain-containing protein [Gammaproteobacteria bacterium]|nr:YcgL domain-containing protein [Gammaproteobacteria bacterium]MCY4228050.1 YcgL domain-containing protein [Gammaproteobacteria bacterium]MCY4312266.1 YcgL domain-containing protein [Gammaproteobacteria bacterium]